VNKFKIGQSVRLRSSAKASGMPGDEYRVVGQLPRTDNIIRYRVRSSADEQHEIVVQENELHDR
jgi:hypothetical protein